MKKVSQIEIYKYNFIGNPPEQECYGPTAQDWHKHFGAPEIEVPKLKGQRDTNEPLFEKKPAKDPLMIEQNDMIGVLFSCAKYLHSQNNTLSDKIDEVLGKMSLAQ